MIATILSMAVQYSYAQDPVPDRNWPSHTVINGSTKHFEVQGDVNYDEPSTFTWTVYGGTIYLDQALTQKAGDGTTVQVTGDENNATEIWVIWDVFTKSLDFGYIYVKELSADGCEKDISDLSKYSGLNLRVIAPPDVRFLSDVTNACSYDLGVNVEVEVAGFAPFDLTYVLNGDTIKRTVEAGEMVDSDLDGKENNLVFTVNDFFGTTIPRLYEFELIEAVSEGVPGQVLEYPTHTINVYPQPPAPLITESWVEITQGESHLMTLDDAGIDGEEYFWEVYNSSGTFMYEQSNLVTNASINFDFSPGDYQLIAYYRSVNGCLSLSDTLDFKVFLPPTLAFADSSENAIGCSAVSLDEDDSFEFVLDYQGALSFDFSFEVYDYNDILLWGDTLQYLTTRNPIITIPNNFINDELPELDRIWKVILTEGRNGEGVEIDILDDEITGGRNERTIRIHPKPIITDDIDFEN